MNRNNRILIIDDDREIWKAFQRVLCPPSFSAGPATEKIFKALENFSLPIRSVEEFQLTFAAQGPEGLAIFSSELAAGRPFALTFIDIRMPPGFDGMETAKQIRQVDRFVEIVLVTAFSDRSRDEIAQVVGTPEKLLFIRKPFDHEELKQLAVSLTSKWHIGRQEYAQRKKLQAILETSPAAIFSLDRDLVVHTWNPAAEQITGYTAAEVIQAPCIFKTISQTDLFQSLSGKNPRQENIRELSIVDKSGNRRILVLTLAYLQDQGEFPETIIGSFWDITDIKQTEKALISSENRIRALIETTSDFVWEVDAHGHYTYCSPVCQKIYGYEPEELIGKHFSETLQPEDHSRLFMNIFNNCIRAGENCHAQERHCRTKQGVEIIVESSAAIVLDEKGEVCGFRGIDRDITVRKRNEQERLQLQQQFQQTQKLEALGTLAGGIAHDLNNILTPIMGFSKILQMRETDEKTLNSLEIIENCATRASTLIKKILAFTRNQQLEVMTLKLDELIYEFSKIFKRLIRADVKLVFELHPDLWSIEADSSQMGQVLINLVVNARDAVKEGGQLVIRTTNLTVTDNSLFDVDNQLIRGEFVVLSVSDDGSGIPESIIKEIFNPFFTTKAVGEGTGLGLATVYGIIGQHNGHIRVVSRENVGTTFSIYLPRSGKLNEKQSEDHPDSEPYHGSGMVLVAEDNPEILGLLGEILADFGHAVILAADGQDAWQKYLETGGKIDLLLTDIIMPNLGGLALANRIRSERPDIPVLYISGHTYDTNIEELLRNPRNGFLLKPFSHLDIAKKMADLLGMHSTPVR